MDRCADGRSRGGSSRGGRAARGRRGRGGSGGDGGNLQAYAGDGGRLDDEIDSGTSAEERPHMTIELSLGLQELGLAGEAKRKRNLRCGACAGRR